MTSHFSEQWENLPAFLNGERRADPFIVLDTIFDSVSLYYCRMTILDLLSTAMGSEIIDACPSRQCADLVFFCHRMQELLEAGYILSKMNQEGRITMKPA